MNEKVTIIVTCYNQQDYIEACIESVINQTYPNWECIIVNDGSTDNSENICKKMSLTDSRIRYYHQQNTGVSEARNVGYELSTGYFIQFLDGDDYLAPEKLQVQVEFLNDHKEVDVCYSNHLFYLQDKGIHKKHAFKSVGDDALNDLLYLYDNGVSIPIHTALIRKDVWHTEVPFTRQYHGRYEDWVFWVEIALKKARFAFIDYDLALYRIHKANFCWDEQQVKNNALGAMNYIATLLPQNQKQRFIDSRREFFENRQTFTSSDEGSPLKRIIDFTNKIKAKVSSKRRQFAINNHKIKEQKYQAKLRSKLKNKTFSIISNNCWGGGVYEDLKLPYTSPTIGLYFFAPCYIRFVQNLDYFLNQRLSFITTSKYEPANALRKHKPYPIGILDNQIEIHFLYYLTKKEALEKWNRRKERVNKENLFFSFTDNEVCTMDEIKRFDGLGYPKVFFSSQKHEGVFSLVWLKQFENQEKVGDLYLNKDEYRQYFNVIDWLNKGGIGK